MRYLADTNLLLWAGLFPEKLSKTARNLLRDPQNEIFFSTASIWETAIKFGRGKSDFTLPPATFRRALLSQGYGEILITSDHVIAVSTLPPHHNDPFDRLLVAQAAIEGVTLLTADKTLARYLNTRRV